MPIENAIDIFVVIRFGELYSANLNALLRRMWWFVIILALFGIFCLILVFGATQLASDDRSTGIFQNLMPWFLCFIWLAVLIPIITFFTARRTFRDPRVKDGCKYH